MAAIAKQSPSVQLTVVKRGILAWGVVSVPCRGQPRDSVPWGWRSRLDFKAWQSLSSLLRFLRFSRSHPREFLFNILHCALSPKNFIFPSPKLDSVCASGNRFKNSQRSTGDDCCSKNEAEKKDTEEDNRKQKVHVFLPTHAALEKMTKRPAPPPLFPPKQDANQDRWVL